jgi:16S rRNA C967 or C1407 C5-methylase (RsmB/RsmF family)/NOL1/NOP2/fmu family ribosome biogenesis protein
LAKRFPPRNAQIPIRLPASVEALLGPEADALLNALSGELPISIRLNPSKPSTQSDEVVPWCAAGRYLRERPVFTLDPLFHAGGYYVQEASSMFLEQAFRRTGLSDQDILALDLCAAPGGKSTHLASLLSPGSLLVCNEPVPARRHVLAENIWKQGRANTLITGSQPHDLTGLGEFFDLILVDAPCSGEGMFRKDPFARQQWTERLVNACSRTQHTILERAWNTLLPGGWLIYSTCTWERSENEDQVNSLVERGAEFVPVPSDETWGLVNTDAGHRCYPHRVKGEGFFLSLLRKPGELCERKPAPALESEFPALHAWLCDPTGTQLGEHEEKVYALPTAWRAETAAIQAHMRIASPGIPIAEKKGMHWRPHAALALNERVNAAAFAVLDLERQQALSFLRGETSFASGSNLSDGRGVQLVRYEDHALGWLHAAGDRWNNGWPKEWRIRMR